MNTRMYAELTIYLGPPDDEVTITHMRPIKTLNDIKKFPEEIKTFSMGFLDVESQFPLIQKEEKLPLADRVKFLDD